ncbi:hypothetical protein ACWDUN_23500 [Mycobacterium sp. NPDC003323]
MPNTKFLVVALALTGLGFLGAGTAFADEPVTPVPATTSQTTVLADDDWDDWYDDDWDD